MMVERSPDGSGYSPEVEPQASPAEPSIPNARDQWARALADAEAAVERARRSLRSAEAWLTLVRSANENFGRKSFTLGGSAAIAQKR